MFKENYIFELITGKLSASGYEHFLNVIRTYAIKYNWPKNLIIGKDITDSNYWRDEEIQELAHQFLETSLTKGKFDYLDKIPRNYLSYYFSQILISFVADRIKEEQQKRGLSFDKCRELVYKISSESFEINPINGKSHVYIEPFTADDKKSDEQIKTAFNFMSKVQLPSSVKHYKPYVKMVMDDIFNFVESPLSEVELTNMVFKLFEQKEIPYEIDIEENVFSEPSFDEENKRHQLIVNKLIDELPGEDLELILMSVFKMEGKHSISELSKQFDIPSSTLYYKINSFKKQIADIYTPDSEEDGIKFLKIIASTLENRLK